MGYSTNIFFFMVQKKENNHPFDKGAIYFDFSKSE